MHYPTPIFDIPTGVAPLDNLHQDFLAGMQCLASAPDHAFAHQYEDFVRLVEKIFRIEETWMEELDCAIVLCHREQHARVLSALHHVHTRVLAGDIAVGRDVAERLLPQWFALHVETLDAALGTVIACAGANVSVADAETREPVISYID